MKPPHLLKRLAIRVGIFGLKSTCMCIFKTYTQYKHTYYFLVSTTALKRSNWFHYITTHLPYTYIQFPPSSTTATCPDLRSSKGVSRSCAGCFFLPKKQTCRHFVITLKNYRQVYCYSSMRRRGNSNGHVPWARFWSTERVLSTFMRGSASDNCPSLSL